MSFCTLCPRQCGVDRKTVTGVCRAPAEILVARAAPHFGEEPCLSGERGAGTVFFAGCPLGCVYCQNFALSRAREGKTVSVERLAQIFRELEAQGVHCLDLVTGTQYTPGILAALSLAKPTIPVVWNSSGYESVETVCALSQSVDVFLPDMKYALPAVAARYSRAGDYPEVTKAAIVEMVRQTGPFQLSEDGLLTRGVLIRHLILPGQVENTRRVIEWVSETFAPDEVMFSLMAQYTPCGELSRYPEFSRRITAEEWDAALEALDASDIENGFVQEREAAGEDAIPAFDGTGV